MKQFSRLFIVVLVSCCATAQTPDPPNPCGSEVGNAPACAPGEPLNGGQPPYFSATPLMDGSSTTLYLPSAAHQQTVSLYGSYGNTETSGAAHTHYAYGLSQAAKIVPLCTDGTINYTANMCAVDGKAPAIVFLFIGFSNWNIEIGGGSVDIWTGGTPNHPLGWLPGQPCATYCENLNNQDGLPPWNQAVGDSTIQNSFLYQVYPPKRLVAGGSPCRRLEWRLWRANPGQVGSDCQRIL
jgi:hypothetical protein